MHSLEVGAAARGARPLRWLILVICPRDREVLVVAPAELASRQRLQVVERAQQDGSAVDLDGDLLAALERRDVDAVAGPALDADGRAMRMPLCVLTAGADGLVLRAFPAIGNKPVVCAIFGGGLAPAARAGDRQP
jgi:hypothetical protein